MKRTHETQGEAQLGEGRQIWCGSVAAWECDTNNHLNIGFYVAKAMEALIGLAAELGMPHAFAAEAQATLMVRDLHIRFLREALPEKPLTMNGGVLEMGDDEARLLLVMRHGDGDIATVFQMTVAHVTAKDLRPFPWPARARERAAAMRAAVPQGYEPRGVPLTPVASQASLARAEALGTLRTGLGGLTAADCDVFGRMRADHFMARLSLAAAILFAKGRGGEQPGRRVGGAALEYRLVFLAWPKAGDRVELRSGIAAAERKTRRLVHWMLDPTTGKALALAEAVVVSFDLDLRKAIALDDEALAFVRAQVVEGLTL